MIGELFGNAYDNLKNVFLQFPVGYRTICTEKKLFGHPDRDVLVLFGEKSLHRNRKSLSDELKFLGVQHVLTGFVLLKLLGRNPDQFRHPNPL